MKYICFGYIEPGKFEGMTEDERNATFDECFEHNGHLVEEVPSSALSPSALPPALKRVLS
jgi:hypothetical protein